MGRLHNKKIVMDSVTYLSASIVNNKYYYKKRPLTSVIHTKVKNQAMQELTVQAVDVCCF
jgi:hypothetical protein